MDQLGRLWQGDLRLGDVFWNWAVFGGVLVNLVTSVLFLILISLDRPWLAFIIGYVFSVPYNLVVVVGVWRSAARHRGSRLHADLARWAAVILMSILSLT